MGNIIQSDKVIILDRDGVINHDSDDYIKSPDEWIPIEGSLEAIAKLNAECYKVFIFTNQSGIGRGYYTLDTLQDMHEKMRKLLLDLGGHIEAIFFCPHTPEQRCKCRKPKTGMLEELAQRYQIDLAQTRIVGDSLKDMQAARQVNARAYLVKTGKGKRTIRSSNCELEALAIPVFKDLADFTSNLLADKLE